MVGRTLDRYRLLEEVGQGGMAVVYRALDISLCREVAVKVLHPHLASQPESRARLQREAQAVAQLHHDNIPEIFAYSGLDSEVSYLVTEFVHGSTLKHFITDHPPGYPEIGMMIASEVASALSCAHEMGIIHRDVKPENVMIRDSGSLLLCDFGIAQVVDKDRMTATGQLLGSPAYMAPEHIEGRPLDCRTDVFSLGVLTYQMVCGELPFRGRNPHETLRKITDGHFTPPEELARLCSPRLSRLIGRALSREPDGRYPRVSQLRDELLAELSDSGIGDPREELRAYFLSPETWQAAFAPRLSKALIETGSRRRREGRTAAALSAWGRAQQVDPENPEVRRLIEGVAREGRRRRALGYGLGVLGVAALGVFGGASVSAWRRAHPVSPDSRPGPPAWTPGPAPVDGSSLAPQTTREDPPDLWPARFHADAAAAGPVPRHPTGHHRPVPTAKAAEAVVLRRVPIEPWPKAVRVSLNGKLLGDYGSDVRVVELPPGPNELLFENPACYSQRVAIPADASPEEVRVRLRWKPALLTVRSQPADADVVVDGRILGRSGQVLALPLSNEEGKAAVEVKVSAPDHATVTKKLEVRANQMTSLDVTLEPG